MADSVTAPRPLFRREALTRLIVPLVIEQFLLMSVGMMDTVMVTTAGQAAVSGVSLVDNINQLIIQIFSALSTGGAVICSQYLGRQDVEDARTAAKQLLYTVFGLALVLMAGALCFRQHILSLLFGNIESDVMDSALVYFLATAMAYPFISLYNAGAALFRSMGNSKVSMFNSLIVNLVNVAVNAALIYGCHMGALGAGIGTLVSRIVAAVFILYLLQHHDNLLKIEGLFQVRIRRDMVGRILTIGIPNGLENGLFQAGKLVVLSLITTFGTNAVAANAIANSVAGVVCVPGQAVGLAMITVVGQCMGARQPEQAVSYAWRLVGIVYAAMGTMSVLMFLFSEQVCSIFQLTPEAAAMAALCLRWCMVFYLLIWPLAFTLPNALRAAGDAVFTMAVSLMSMFLFRIAFSYVLSCSWGFSMGLLGVWIAMIIDWGVRSLVFVIRFCRGGWKKIQLI
ncbi:MATE family efflux transporter [Pseudoflavonifractor sp. MSJ-37]|uniref:MATE family efflux transporter n=1 Tax=Pseudoflavonifractor sp. MSJ-37 TaxID=2841531 RepID=UPI001C11D754|nr:MATE family efflux transporter [Pseudoflavonifractor sp. MSJ-37]MBU5434435.1 MATE family efflux transporter [Pseudoflavonifractor sp. MSJ-37]